MYQQGPPAPHIDEPRHLRAGPVTDTIDAAPLTGRQIRALAAAAIRQLCWGLRLAARETRQWRGRATRIPDAETREDALNSLSKKRGHIDGAALFWTIPRRRNPDLLRLLVAYQIMWDFLDNVSERGAVVGTINGHQLHRALVDALDHRHLTRDYYRWHQWQDDADYLRTLVGACSKRAAKMRLCPGVRSLLMRDARRASVQAINHEPDSDHRASSLYEWAIQEASCEQEASWFEFASAASAGLSIYALIAFGSEPVPTTAIAQIYRAYFPWVSATTTMLDSYVDQAEDAETGDHAYVAYYPAPEDIVPRIVRLIRRGFNETRSVGDAERHLVIVASMIALHLSRDSAKSAELQAGTKQLAKAAGSLTLLLTPILRLWRIAYAQQAS